MIDLKTINLKDRDTQKFLIAISAGIVAIVAFLLFMIVPKATKLVSLIKSNSQLSIELKDTELNIARTEKMKEKKDGLQKKISSSQERFLEQRQIPVFLEELSKLAEEADVKLNSLKLPKAAVGSDWKAASAASPARKKASVEDKYEKVPIFIEAECGFHELGSFINKLENAKRFIGIADMEIAAQKDSVKLHKVSLNIETIARREAQ